MRQVKAFHLLLLYALYVAGMVIPSMGYQDSACSIRNNSEFHTPHHSKSFINTTGHASLLPAKYVKSSYPSGGKGKGKSLLSGPQIMERKSFLQDVPASCNSIIISANNRTDKIPVFLRNRALII